MLPVPVAEENTLCSISLYLDINLGSKNWSVVVMQWFTLPPVMPSSYMGTRWSPNSSGSGILTQIPATVPGKAEDGPNAWAPATY